jgi:hypothetical protein
MALFIKLYQPRQRHPKTLNLAVLLGISRRETCGLLDDLWTWAVDVADRDGNMKGVTPESVAVVLDYPPDRGEWLVGALIAAGWMEQTDGGLSLHNWGKYVGTLFDKRTKDAAYQAKRREEIAKTSARQKEDAATASDMRRPLRPDQTRPDQTRPDQTSKVPAESSDSGSAAGAPDGVDDSPKDPVQKAEGIQDKRFGEFWAAYPKKVGKIDARRAFDKIKGMAELFPLIMAAVERNKTGNPQWRKDNGQFIPQPATWLNRGGWDDEQTRPNGSPRGKFDPFAIQDDPDRYKPRDDDFGAAAERLMGNG